MWRRRRGRLQWIALASPSEVAWGRIISFLLMSSTSWEGEESITLLLFSFFFSSFGCNCCCCCCSSERHIRILHYRRVTQWPASPHTRLSHSLTVCVSHTHFCMRLSFYLAGSIGKDSCHVEKAFSAMRFLFFFFYLKPTEAIKKRLSCPAYH